MSFDKRVGVAMLAAVVLGCTTNQESSSTLGAPPPCTGQFCGSPAGGNVASTGSGGSSGTGVSTGTGTSTGAIDVKGSVNRIVSEDFLGGNAYPGAVTIQAPGPGGAVVSVNYGSINGTGGAGGEMPFALDGVESGNDWVLVADDSMGNAGILSTFSVQDLTSVPATLPVLDLGTLQMIADGLPSLAMTGGVSTLASQIILKVSFGPGAPAAGVTLSGNPIGGSVVYDTGDGVYDDTATTTGTGGTIIVFNAALSGTATLTLSYTSPTTSMPATLMVPIQGAAGAATFVTPVMLD